MNIKKLIVSFLLMSFNGSGIVFGAADQSVSLQTENILSNREPIDIEKMAGAYNLLLVGDDHTQPAIKDFLKNRLVTLKRLGFNYLALEMLPSNLQDNLNTWNPENRQKVRNHLETFWASKGPGVVDSLMCLVEAAKQQGMTVIALEHPLSERMTREAVNPYWAERIQNYLSEDKANKIIVLCGSAHLKPAPGSLYCILKDKEFSPSVVQFSGLDPQRSIQREVEVAKILGKTVSSTTQVALAVFRSGVHGDFMVEFTESPTEQPYWVINFTPKPAESSILLAQL